MCSNACSPTCSMPVTSTVTSARSPSSAEQEHQPLPTDLDYTALQGLRKEAAHTLNTYRPATLGQASRLAGVNPADLMILSVSLAR